jgi:hypothetical protein
MRGFESHCDFPSNARMSLPFLHYRGQLIELEMSGRCSVRSSRTMQMLRVEAYR